MRRFARSEFDQHRSVTDLGHIRYLISVRRPRTPAACPGPLLTPTQHGKTQFQTIKGTLINAGLLSE